jgi:sigma-B regulation protein RsbU (phosphoserine phosphatase)
MSTSKAQSTGAQKGPLTLDAAARVLPAGDDARAGDFWLLEERADGSVYVVVGDVTGHGDQAADCADKLRGLVLAAVPTAASPCHLLEAANNALMAPDSPPDLFATAAAVLLEDGGDVTWAYAGHLPPHRLDDGRPLDGATPGLPLGVLPTVGCSSEGHARLAAGDGMLLYTDGLEEARGPGGDRFGTARVTHALAQIGGRSAEETVDTLAALVCEFSEGDLSDDVCVVAFRLR